MKNWKVRARRGFSLLIALAMCASILQTAAFAVNYDIGVGSVYVESDGSWQENNKEWTSQNRNKDTDITITQGADETISGSEKAATDHSVEVGKNVEDVTITLDDVNIEAKNFHSGVSIGEGSKVTVELDGENSLKGGWDHAGLSVDKGATVTIQDKDDDGGSLTARGDTMAAGIGGNGTSMSDLAGGNVVIDSGVINAVGGGQGAGIGGGRGATFGDITINGGTVNASVEKNLNAWGAAGIGGGSEGSVGNITIDAGTDGTVTGSGSYGGAGIGAGYGGRVEKIDIASGDVTAQGGSTGAGIGTGQGVDGVVKTVESTVGELDIRGGTVDAKGGDYAAGIGTGWSSQNGPYHGVTHVDTINISGGTVKAQGGTHGAGIGTGYGQKSSVDEINITTGGTVENAQGGLYGAGIGSTMYANVGSINIGEGSAVTANGGNYAAAIGAGFFGTFGAVNITGGDIVAASGLQASAIGNGSDSSAGAAGGGTIAIQGANSLIALGDTYFAIDALRADVTGVKQNILNARFLEEIGAADSSGLTKVEEIEFVIVNAQGETVQTFPLKPQSGTNMYESFAVNLPEGGTYYVFSKNRSNYNGSIAGYHTDNKGGGYNGKKVAYVISEGDMLNANLMQFPDYNVSYDFKSGTEDRDLPAEIIDQLPFDAEGSKMTVDKLNKLLTGEGFSNKVDVEGGSWSFDGWTSESAISGEGMLRDVTLVGTWSFTPTPPPQPPTPPTPPAPGGDDGPTGGGDDDGDTGTTIDDGEVPLAGDLQLNREDHFAYIKGYADGTVRPNNPLTRAQVATIFYRLLDEMSRTIYFSETNDFSDVSGDFWANKAISTLANAEIIGGFNDGTFRPNAYITRAQFAAIAARFDSVTEGLENPFSDVSEDYWARDLIAYAADRGWIPGEGGKFRPEENITRVEAMDFINNVLERHVDKEGLLEDAQKWTDVPESDPNFYVVEEATNSHDYDRRKEGELMENWTKLNEDPVWDE